MKFDNTAQITAHTCPTVRMEKEKQNSVTTTYVDCIRGEKTPTLWTNANIMVIRPGRHACKHLKVLAEFRLATKMAEVRAYFHVL